MSFTISTPLFTSKLPRGPLTTYTDTPPAQGSLTCFLSRGWDSCLWAFPKWSPPDSPGLAPCCPVCWWAAWAGMRRAQVRSGVWPELGNCWGLGLG